MSNHNPTIPHGNTQGSLPPLNDTGQAIMDCLNDGQDHTLDAISKRTGYTVGKARSGVRWLTSNGYAKRVRATPPTFRSLHPPHTPPATADHPVDPSVGVGDPPTGGSLHLQTTAESDQVEWTDGRMSAKAATATATTTDEESWRRNITPEEQEWHSNLKILRQEDLQQFRQSEDWRGGGRQKWAEIDQRRQQETDIFEGQTAAVKAMLKARFGDYDPIAGPPERGAWERAKANVKRVLEGLTGHSEKMQAIERIIAAAAPQPPQPQMGVGDD